MKNILRHDRRKRKKNQAQVAPQRDGEQRQRCARALYGVRRLGAEELQLRDIA